MANKRRYLYRLLICMIIVCSVLGCSKDVNKETQNETGQETGQKENNQLHSEPIDIDTTGGVVVVGTVCHDENGWYLTPEQPLNLTLHYFLDNPSEFEALRRIELFDSSIDYIEKLPYLGQTVTIEGNLTFYRDYFDRVYLLPYTIYFGKIVEASYGDSDLQAPDFPENKWDSTRPLPEQMNSIVRDGKYVYNPYMLSKEALELMGNDFAEFYCEFVEAFMNYETECSCPDRRFAEFLDIIIYYEFPMYEAYAEPFEFLKHYDASSQNVMIEYKYDKQKHQQKIDEFMEAANVFLSTSTVDQSEKQLAKNIYHEICTRMTYDYSALEDLERKTAYHGYLNHTGVCVTFTNMYNQLLTQVGIEATMATCDTETMGHVWSIITIDGNKYFCDPTYELEFNGGNAYAYFGETYQQRINDNVGTKGIYQGTYVSTFMDESMIASKPLY